MSPEEAFILLGIGAILVAVYGLIRYQTPLNPLTIFCINEIGVFTLGSGIVTYTTESAGVCPPEAIAKTALISLVYLLGATVPFFFRTSWFEGVYAGLLKMLCISSERIAATYSPGKFKLLLGGYVVAFVALMVFSGGGLIWITNPREGYADYRIGTGPLVAICQWTLTLALFYYLWGRRPRGITLIVSLMLFCYAIWFLGSKGNIIFFLVITAIYTNFYVRKLPLLFFLIMAPTLLLGAMVLIVLQGTFPSLIESVIYFRDYFDTSAQFIARFNEFGYMYGGATLSSFWLYVPRAIFPDKPFEYGVLLIHRVLFPGAAEQGYTPGFLLWSVSYLDFGIVGVFLYGIMRSILPKIAYDYYRKHPDRFFAFCIMIQLSLFPVYMFVEPSILFPLMWVQGLFLQLRLVAEPSRLVAG